MSLDKKYILAGLVLLGLIVIVAWKCKSDDSASNSPPPTKLPLPANFREGFEQERVIGMIYPPRLGPLHTNFVLPEDKDSCNSPYAVIYEDKVVFNQCLPNVR